MSLQTKYIAGISLGVMGVGFAASIPFQGTVAGEIIQGGLKLDWLAGLQIGSRLLLYSVIRWEYQFRIQLCYLKTVNG